MADSLKPVLVTPPAATLLSLDEAKAQLRIDHTEEDAFVLSLVQAATSWLDGYSGVLGRALITQEWRQDFPGFADDLRLAVPPLLAVSSVTYYDASNAQQTLASSVYAALSDAKGGFITLKPNQSWPTITPRPDAVRVTWTAGYGAAATAVPEAIRHAVRLITAHLYEAREAAAMPAAVDALIAPFRINPV